jgi:hypothetical protein
MVQTRSRILAIGIATALAVPSAVFAAPASASAARADGPVIAADALFDFGVRSTSPRSVQEFIESDSPKTVEIDAARNAIVAVTDRQDASHRAVSNTCRSGQLCWYGIGVPYANLGFSPAGTTTGTWGGRGTVRANNSAGQVWYVRTATPDLLLTSGAFGRNSVIKIVGSGITGKKVVTR